MANEKLIPLSEVKKKLTAVRQYFSGYPSTDQDKLARSVAKLCMEEVGKIKPVDAVEVPCKIGDTVWCIQNNFGRPSAKQGIVSQMCFVEDMRLSIYVRGLCGGEWGVRVFATREEAEAAIGERRTDNA